MLLLSALPAAAQAVTPRDLAAAFDQLDVFGGFFGAFAARETNSIAQERWRHLSLGYPGTAEILRDLLAQDELRIDDLPAGRVSALLNRGEILIDRDLDGRWVPGLLQAGAGDAARRHDLLLPALVEALARRQPPQDWPWLADHLRAVGGFGVLAQDPVARPLLARFFHAKDSYLWLALQRIGEGDPAARQTLAGRQAAAFRAVRSLASDMAATFGPAPAARLQRDWTDYVAQVDGFAVTRGWLLLDPTLRQTRLGATARREADAIDQAAAETMAAARAGAPPLPVDLNSLVKRAGASEQTAPDQQPEAAGAGAEVATLQSKLEVLAAAVEARAAEAERLEAALAEERERRAAAEAAQRQAAAEAARSLAEAEAARRQAEAVLSAPQLAAAPVPATRDGSALPDSSGQRSFYVVTAVVVIVLLALALWLRRRPREALVEPGPRLLAAPAGDGLSGTMTQAATPSPQASVVRPVAEPAPSPAPSPARVALQPGQPVRVNGVAAPGIAARAAMKAASVRREALRAAGTVPAAAPGCEADTAANPIVQALRKGNLPLFELLFGELSDLRAPQLQRIVYGGRGEDLAIVCRAVGVDKLLFGSLFMLTDHLRGGAPEDEPERTAEMLRIYDRMPPATAQKVLAKWQRNWGGPHRREPLTGG